MSINRGRKYIPKPPVLATYLPFQKITEEQQLRQASFDINTIFDFPRYGFIFGTEELTFTLLAGATGTSSQVGLCPDDVIVNSINFSALVARGVISAGKITLKITRALKTLYYAQFNYGGGVGIAQNYSIVPTNFIMSRDTDTISITGQATATLGGDADVRISCVLNGLSIGRTVQL